MTKSHKVPKQKRKKTPAEKRAKRERRRKYKTIFINGKQKRVLREPTIAGLSVDEFIARNADPIWLHQNEMWELMMTDEEVEALNREAELAEQMEIEAEFGDYPWC